MRNSNRGDIVDKIKEFNQRRNFKVNKSYEAPLLMTKAALFGIESRFRSIRRCQSHVASKKVTKNPGRQKNRH